jgi:hypothetical protein
VLDTNDGVDWRRDTATGSAIKKFEIGLWDGKLVAGARVERHGHRGWQIGDDLLLRRE